MPENEYEIRTTGYTYGYRFLQLVPYCNGKPIAEGTYIDIYGYRKAIKNARKAIRLHKKYGIV